MEKLLFVFTIIIFCIFTALAQNNQTRIFSDIALTLQFELRNRKISFNWKEIATAWQPRADNALSPFKAIQTTFYFNYGRGISSQALRTFYPGQFFVKENNLRQRILSDSAGRTVTNGSVVFSELRGFDSSLSPQRIGNYQFNGEDSTFPTSVNNIVNLALSKRMKKWANFNFSLDNVFNERYYETQNYFESRVCPTCDAASRIHATPGYPSAVSIGLTFRLFAKN